ncbi:MAG: acyloxyacyl hydrolase [Desulfatiglandaceae bacterium]
MPYPLPIQRNALRWAGIALLLLILLPSSGRAEEKQTDPVRDRYGFALSYGNTFTPDSDIGFWKGTLWAMFDYDKIWGHSAPEALRFKVELSLGSTTRPEYKLMASTGMMALYYLDCLSTRFMTPYIEGGIGIIYTDFQVEGQGSRINFNPRAGLGVEFPMGRETLFTALRWDHISNGGLNKDNQGIDSCIFMVGVYF